MFPIPLFTIKLKELYNWNAIRSKSFTNHKYFSRWETRGLKFYWVSTFEQNQVPILKRLLEKIEELLTWMLFGVENLGDKPCPYLKKLKKIVGNGLVSSKHFGDDLFIKSRENRSIDHICKKYRSIFNRYVRIDPKPANYSFNWNCVFIPIILFDWPRCIKLREKFGKQSVHNK